MTADSVHWSFGHWSFVIRWNRLVVRHDHHRRRPVGPGGGHSPGLLRAAGLHSRAALHDRRAEFVLSPPRPRLRRRPARRHELRPEGRRRRARWPGCCGSCGCRWDDFALAPQLGSAIAFPGVRLAFNNDIGLLESEIARAFPRQKRQLPAAARPDSRLRRPEPGRVRAFGPAGSGGHDHRSAAGRDAALPADVVRQRPRGRHGLGAVLHHVPRSSWKGMGRPHAGIRLILKNLVRKFRSLGGELKLRSGVSRIQHRRRPGRRRRARQRPGADGAQRSFVGRRGRNAAAVRFAQRGRRRSRAGQLVVRRVALGPRPAAAGARLRPDDRVFQRLGEVSLAASRQSDLCDVRTGVICSPNNFAYAPADGELADSLIRITALANFDRWQVAAAKRTIASKSCAGTTGWPPRPCGSCPTFAAA